MTGPQVTTRYRQLLNDLLHAALQAANPAACLPQHLPAPPKAPGRTIVIGAGKAAAAMAQCVETHWPSDAPLYGLVVTRYGHDVPAPPSPPSSQPSRRIEVIEAAHPVPDASGLTAAIRMRSLLTGLTTDDLVLVLLSGGGSALLVEPLPGMSLDDKQAITRRLLASGAAISEINCVRKHLSAIKGGRLALAAAPARLLTLAISDVPGDVLSAIASGPTVADPTSCAEALAICQRYDVALPEAVRELLRSGAAETPKPGDPRFAACTARVITSAQASLHAAAAVARAANITPLILGDRIEGEAREVARALAGMALSCAEHGLPVKPPCVLLSGGETTVTLGGKKSDKQSGQPGRGGRNSEFLLALALALSANSGGHRGIHALAVDTDGIDGSEDNAGAFLDPETLTRARAAGLNAQSLLDNNDAYSLFAASGDLIITGPTRTNVNDFRAIVIP